MDEKIFVIYQPWVGFHYSVRIFNVSEVICRNKGDSNLYTIEQFKNLNKLESMVMTQHSRKRFAERGISIDDVMNTILTGEIIEMGS